MEVRPSIDKTFTIMTEKVKGFVLGRENVLGELV
jgi:hypothetical protein